MYFINPTFLRLKLSLIIRLLDVLYWLTIKFEDNKFASKDNCDISWKTKKSKITKAKNSKFITTLLNKKNC